VLTGGLIVRLMARAPEEPRQAVSERVFWGAVVATGVIAVTGFVTFREARNLSTIQPMYETRKAAAMIPPGETIYTDPLSRKALEFYWRYAADRTIKDFEGADQSAIVPGSYVLVDKNRLAWLDVNVSMWLTKDYGYHEPAFSDAAPSGWDVRWRNQYATLYRVK